LYVSEAIVTYFTYASICFADGYAQVLVNTDLLRDQTDREIGIYSAHLTLLRTDNDIHPVVTTDNLGVNEVLLFYELLPGNMSRLMVSEIISLSAKTRQLKINVENIVKNWKDETYASPHRAIEIRTVGATLLGRVLALPSSDSFPVLDICTYVKNTRNDDVLSRTRRSTKKKKSRKKCDGNCCRHPVEIKYADLGLQIEGVYDTTDTFTAYICSGKCRRDSNLYTNYSHIKNLLYKMTKDKTYKNRCVPKSYKKDFELFHFNQHGILGLGVFDDIIVKDCACT
jgi:hypothetical protein